MDRCRDRNLDRERIRTDPCGSRARLSTELDPPAHVAWQGVGWHAARGRENAIRFELEPTVAVIDNATGATLLSCTVNATSKGSCSNTGSSPPVAPGHRIEVKVTANGSSCNNRAWQVSFRY